MHDSLAEMNVAACDCVLDGVSVCERDCEGLRVWLPVQEPVADGVRLCRGMSEAGWASGQARPQQWLARPPQTWLGVPEDVGVLVVLGVVVDDGDTEGVADGDGVPLALGDPVPLCDGVGSMSVKAPFIAVCV